MNARDHGSAWIARSIAIECMLANIYKSPLQWSEVGALYQALLLSWP